MKSELLDNWGVAERYVFRFPEPEACLLFVTANFSLTEIETSAKLLGWLNLNGVKATDYDRIGSVAGMVDKDPATLRHYRKLFEQAGLVVVDHSGVFVTTPLGDSVRTFVQDVTEAFTVRFESIATEVLVQLA